MGRSAPASSPAEAAERDAAHLAKLEALHATLTEQVAALRDGSDWQRWLAVAARFHHYSLNNVLLIAAQRPQATAVAGFRAWKALGRQVDRGQKGIAILAPVRTRAPRDGHNRETHQPDGPGDSPGAAAGTSGGAPQGPRGAAAPTTTGRQQTECTQAQTTASTRRGGVAGFRIAYVFDVAQTSGAPLPQQPVPQLLAGQAPDGLWQALARQVTDRGFTLRRGDCGPGVNGLTHYRERTVTVRADVDDAQAVKTLAHELGHVLLHDPTEPALAGTGPAPPLPAGLTSAGQCRGRIEVEAESVAYLIAASHGLDTGSYTFPYVAGWASSVGPTGASTPDAVVRATAGRVLAAARLVLADTHGAAPPGHPKGLVATQPLELSAPPAADGPTAAGVAVPPVGTELAALQLAGRVGNAPAPPLPSTGRVERLPTAHRGSGFDLGQAEPSPERLIQVHDLATAFYRTRLHTAPDGQRASAWLAGRGVDAEAAAFCGLGYAPRDWTQLVDHLRGRGVEDCELLASGLAMTSSRGTLVDRFRDRVIFPVQDGHGRTVAVLGRIVEEPGTGTSAQSVPKYLNSPDTAIYRKSQVLYGLGPAGTSLNRGSVPVLVEGPMDVLAINCSNANANANAPAGVTAGDGHPGFVGVAPCGTALTTAQVALLEHAAGGLAERGVLVAFDGDAAGRQAAVRAFGLLRQTGAWPHVLDLPDRQDPADVLQQHGPGGVRAALLGCAGRPLADLVVDERIGRHAEQLRWPEGRIAAGRDAAAFLVTLPPEQVARQVVRLAVRLDLPTAEVSSLLIDALGQPSPDRDRASRDTRAPAPWQAERGAGRATASQSPRSPAAPAAPSAAQRARAGFPQPLAKHLKAGALLPPQRHPPAAPPEPNQLRRHA
jgi:DNA primase